MSNQNWFDTSITLLSKATMSLSVVIVMVIFYEIVMRYFFSRPTLWAYELAWWLAGIIYLIAGIYVMEQKSHIRITVIYDKFPKKLQKVCDVLTWLCILSFCLAVIWGSFNEAYRKLVNWELLGSAWNPPIPATLYPLIIVVIVLITIQGLLNLIRDWHK